MTEAELERLLLATFAAEAAEKLDSLDRALATLPRAREEIAARRTA
jgi:hypothetical protein